jgi:hypothetical protein
VPSMYSLTYCCTRSQFNGDIFFPSALCPTRLLSRRLNAQDYAPTAVKDATASEV